MICPILNFYAELLIFAIEILYVISREFIIINNYKVILKLHTVEILLINLKLPMSNREL